MSYNQNFYENLRGQQNYNTTFHGFRPPFQTFNVPPPTISLSQPIDNTKSDQDYIKTWEAMIESRSEPKHKVRVSIGAVRDQLKEVIKNFNEIKIKEKYLNDNIDVIANEEWQSKMQEIQKNKNIVDNVLNEFNDTYIAQLRNVLAKRSSKRMRIKRLKNEQKKEKEKRLKEREEISRRIDEHLQKIYDDIAKAKQEEEDKVQADIILRDVLRKKQDAKKCITKLEALLKLRKARQNTAKGRGEQISEQDEVTFNSSIDKLKSMWLEKLSQYEKEETDLRLKLKEDSNCKASSDNNKSEQNIEQTIADWQECMFGDKYVMPQRDFKGDRNHFIFVRSQWDQFLNAEGTSLPIGWVYPNKQLFQKKDIS